MKQRRATGGRGVYVDLVCVFRGGKRKREEGRLSVAETFRAHLYKKEGAF